ncbi:hypothetical protein GCM10009077_43170 [Roseibium denhamense]
MAIASGDDNMFQIFYLPQRNISGVVAPNPYICPLTYVHSHRLRIWEVVEPDYQSLFFREVAT